ncbi:MAG TPA: N-acetylmuramoyl-L-alanine amidase [Vicinamibacterales bacterium]|nr:N-acetylmuramoyl-L-alanine amidase [Vicinamibacterales bacterium]
MNFRAPSRFLILFFAATLAISSAFAAALSSQAAPSPALTILSKEGRRSIPIATVGDHELVALDDLSSIFQLTTREDALGAITVSYKGKTIVLTPDQALASVSGRLVSLPAPPTRSGRRWLVPAEFISRALGLIYEQRLDLRKPSRLLVVGDVRVPRLAVRYEAVSPTAARLTIDATPRAASTVTQEAEHLTVRFEADALDASGQLLPPQPPQSLVTAVRVVDATTLAVDLGPRFAGFRATSQTLDDLQRVVLDLLGQSPTDAAPPAPQPQPASPAQPAPSDTASLFGQTASAIHTIALDAGHGGEDEGVHVPDGAKEKDLALTVARRVKGIVEARLGLRVLLTRDDDRNVPIDERTALANNNKADLFISLHANGSMRPTTTGAAIFLAAFDKDAAQAAAAGGAERLPTFGGGSRDIEMVPWDLAQTRHLNQSERFANLVEQQFRDRVPMASRPIDRAPLRVLESANMPAVLIELGYLTNPEQAKLLTSDAFQNLAAQGIFDAIVRFRDTLTPPTQSTP